VGADKPKRGPAEIVIPETIDAIGHLLGLRQIAAKSMPKPILSLGSYK